MDGEDIVTFFGMNCIQFCIQCILCLLSDVLCAGLDINLQPDLLSSDITARSSGGLEESVTDHVLHAAFLSFGDIKDVSVPLDHKDGTPPHVSWRLVYALTRSAIATGKHRGFGFVEFVDK